MSSVRKTVFMMFWIFNAGLMISSSLLVIYAEVVDRTPKAMQRIFTETDVMRSMQQTMLWTSVAFLVLSVLALVMAYWHKWSYVLFSVYVALVFLVFVTQIVALIVLTFAISKDQVMTDKMNRWMSVSNKVKTKAQPYSSIEDLLKSANPMVVIQGYLRCCGGKSSEDYNTTALPDSCFEMPGNKTSLYTDPCLPLVLQEVKNACIDYIWMSASNAVFVLPLLMFGVATAIAGSKFDFQELYR